MRNIFIQSSGVARFQAVLWAILLTVVFWCGPLAAPVEGSGAQGSSQVAEAAPAVAHGAEKVAGAEKSHEPGMFDINPWILLSQIINFFVLLWLLNRFLYGPINEVLEARRRKIAESIEAAEIENRRAGELRGQYEGKLAQVDQEAYQIKQKAITEAQAARDEIIAGARTKSAEMVEKAQQEIKLEKKKAWADLREEVVRLSLLVAERVIEKSLDKKAHHELINKAIDSLERPK